MNNPTTPSVALVTLGCAKNLVNSEQMLALLVGAGFFVAPEVDGADVAVINTCGFIDAAKREAIDTILEAAELKSAGRLKKIVVAGCLAERYRDEIRAELPEVDAIVGVGAFGGIVETVRQVLDGVSVDATAAPEAFDDDLPRVVSTPKAWAYIKIADGCDNRCAFCVIPTIRGKYRSRRRESIVAEARALAESGVRELIVIAQDTTRYGVDLYRAPALAELLRELAEIEELRWIRVHYMYPDAIDDALIDVFARTPKLLPYFDIPLQHIDDAILKNMRRRGDSRLIRDTLSRIRARVPNAVIRTSLIVGLPGEGDAEFDALCDFTRESGIERAGVFVYSPEEGTDAAAMPRVDEDIAGERAELLERVQSENIDRFNEARIGERCDVLIEERLENDEFLARSYAESPEIDGYIFVRGEGLQIGEFCSIIIDSVRDGNLVGAPEEDMPA
ncbi:MAG: 30S ribosomal protein S12 methylthiotransferase RimO [Oscillospiraceae bacterium]|jgi:ribosomal protein S12 methylthiotransferase|nr:30S ribosomal protein S12 methylthiotransferase RimO [Oscillospiraceae bacterium]